MSGWKTARRTETAGLVLKKERKQVIIYMTDTKTGLQYLRTRYYDAETGRFTTEDKDLGTSENPLTRNRYIYVLDNPLNYCDPTGRKRKSLLGKTKGIGQSVGNWVNKNVVQPVKNLFNKVTGKQTSDISAKPKKSVDNSRQEKYEMIQPIVPKLQETGNLMLETDTTKLCGNLGISNPKLHYYDQTFQKAGVAAKATQVYCNTDKNVRKDNSEGNTKRGTFSFGFNVDAALGVGASETGLISFDRYGNVATQTSVSAPGYYDTKYIGVFDVGVSFVIQITNAETVFDLEGYGENADK